MLGKFSPGRELCDNGAHLGVSLLLGITVCVDYFPLFKNLLTYIFCLVLELFPLGDSFSTSYFIVARSRKVEHFVLIFRTQITSPGYI